MAKTHHIFFIIALSAALVAGLAWWGESRTSTPELLLQDDGEEFAGPYTAEEKAVINPNPTNILNPKAEITTNKGVITLELYANTMPITVGNFVKLASENFYDGTKFHRVIENFMIQAGDPNTKTPDESTWGRGGPGYAIADEHVAGAELSNIRGTISMANSGPNTGGSQWFINLIDNSRLDFDKGDPRSKHPVFGRVIDGMPVVDEIASVDTKPGDVPVEPIVIESIKIVE